MAQSIPGGAFKDASGNWHDADGRPLSKEAQAEAEKLYAEQAQQRADADRLQVLIDAQSNPIARALYAQQQQVAAAPAPSKKAGA